MEADLSGRTVGKYEIQRRVGSGALGVVYRAVSTRTGQLVAINQVRHELVSNPKLWKSLQQQVELVSQLHHPVIAVVGGLIEDSGTALLVTEWIDGENLEFYLLSHGALTPTSATELMRPICSAFVYAHSCGIWHGWLHAANVLITPAGPKLTNFGLERRVEMLYGKRAELAASRAIFMPPEWRRGERLDKAGDVYMLGALLFQMLTGKQRPALPGADNEHLPGIDELLRQFRQYLPLEFASLLRRAMAPDPRHRHGSVKEFESGMLAAVRVQISETTASFLPSELGDIAETARVLYAEPQRALSMAFKWYFFWFAAAVIVGMLGFIAFQQGRADKRRAAIDNTQPSAARSNTAPSDVPRGVVPARQQWPSFKSSPRIAVIAGISSYVPSSGFRNLSYASQDAEALYDELTRQGYTAHLLRNAEVMRHALRSEMRDAIAATNGSESTLLFFFAGHGGESGGKQYLATYECAADSLDELCMPLKEVQDLLAGASAPRKMMFIDACRNDPGISGKRANPVNRFSYLAASRGLRILNSTAPGQVSYEEPELKHGVFTYFLLEGVRGRAADGDGLITFNGLSAYTRKMMSDYTYAHNKFQVPYDSGEGSGDFLLAGALK
jgi:serine/threonine protein kinase